MATTKKPKYAGQAACCPECGASDNDTDLTFTVTEATASLVFGDYDDVEIHGPIGWTGTVTVECGNCGWVGDYTSLLPKSRAPKFEEESS